MSNGKHIAIFVLSALLFACAGTRPPAALPGPAPSSVLEEQASRNFLMGKSALEKGDIASARRHFDRTVTQLLQSGKEDPDSRILLNEYVEKIAAIEANLLKDTADKVDEQPDAFIDELIATPIFPPSEQEVRAVQQKVEATAAVVYSIPMVVNPQVVSFLQAYQNIRHERIQKALNRGAAYADAFREIFRRYELPEDLIYLPLIESGYRMQAVSRAKAKGMWQFMAGTARLFGLRVDSMVDERLDPFKSAEAAARFLKNLYEKYGDWYLVLASYNAGPGKVQRAINTLQTRDFFEITQTKYIRKETKGYVPAFLAGLLISKSPQEYGFSIEPESSIFTATQTVEVPSPVSLAKVALALGVPLDDLKEMNPELIRDFTPADKKFYPIRIPKDADPAPLEKLERMTPPRSPVRSYYQIRKGDTLFSIARRFHTTVESLKRANGARANKLKPGTRLVIPRGNS